jgi:hypothetical protein
MSGYRNRDDFDRKWNEAVSSHNKFMGFAVIMSIFYFLLVTALVVIAVVLAWKHWG